MAVAGITNNCRVFRLMLPLLVDSKATSKEPSTHGNLGMTDDAPAVEESGGVMRDSDESLLDGLF
jgi:hypothetical protein